MRTFNFKIPISALELNLDVTLQCGQSFRWFKTLTNHWRGVIGSDVWTLHRDNKFLYCEVTGPEGTLGKICLKQKKTNKTKDSEDKNDERQHFESIISNYFRLDVPLEPLYEQWALADPKFSEASKSFRGIRILHQDPVENTFSFICSSNNNIQRITLLVDRLCKAFGEHIAEICGTDYYAFPKVQSLATPGTEAKLKSLGFGYRAKYIESSAKMIMEKGGEKWLQELRSLKYEDCHSCLMGLTGIGAKVADCICLMSMGHLDAIPVDTHVYQIACRDYLPHLRSRKTVTSKIYKEIGDHFRELYGTYAGWAHSVLFSADLKKFRPKEKSPNENGRNSADKKAKKKKKNTVN